MRLNSFMSSIALAAIIGSLSSEGQAVMLVSDAEIEEFDFDLYDNSVYTTFSQVAEEGKQPKADAAAAGAKAGGAKAATAGGAAANKEENKAAGPPKAANAAAKTKKADSEECKKATEAMEDKCGKKEEDPPTDPPTVKPKDCTSVKKDIEAFVAKMTKHCKDGCLEEKKTTGPAAAPGATKPAGTGAAAGGATKPAGEAASAEGGK